MASEELADRLQVGLPTLRDIVNALAWPGRDPREDLPPPRIKKKILEFEALQVDTELEGTVLNVVDFGAFVDIGLKESGLVHISQLANRYVKSPYDVVSVGDVVSVWVLSVDKERKRVALTMIPPGTKPTRPQPGKKPLWTQSGGTRSSGGGKKQPGDTHPQKPPRTPQPGGSGLRPQPRPQAPPPAGTPQTEGQPSAAPPPRPARTPPRRPAPPPKPQGAPPGKHKKPMSTFGELAALLDERSRDQAAPPPEAQPPSGPRSQAEDAGDESARAERPGPPAEGTPPA
jgi:uncharacterized protein